MAINIALSGNFTLDETAGLQNGADGTPTGSPRSDSDAAVGTLPAAFSTYLFTTLGLSNGFPTAVGVGASAPNLITVTTDGGMNSLGLTDADGNPFDGTQSSGLFTTAGDEIFLKSDLNSQVVLGVTSASEVVFAVYMQPDGPLDGSVNVKLWSVTFEAIDHPVAGSTAAAHDDAVDLLSLVSITATGTKNFDFDDLPSGQNLFGMVGDSSDAIVVVGALPVLNSGGTYTNTSDTINTSKAGGPTTIGIDNQSFNPAGGGTNVNDGAYFTYVENPDARYLAGAAGGLTQNEADDADNVLFGNTKEVDAAFLKIVQVTGTGNASLSLTAYNLTNNTQDGRSFVQNMGPAGGAKVTIDAIRVYAGSVEGTLLEDSANADATNDIVITITNGVASISGLQDGMVVVWETSTDHDQVLVQANTGSAPFDIGLFGLLDGENQSTSLAGRAFVEDSAPTIGPIANSTVKYLANESATKSLNGAFGTDSEGAAYTITNFAATLTVDDVTLTGTINAAETQVRYFEDKDNSGTFTAGDVDYYTLALTQPGGVPSYSFTVNTAPAAPPLTFNFDNLPSGQNLFGTVADSPGGPGIIVFGQTPVLKANGTYANTSNTINTSQGGAGATIGINNQMFDAGEGAYFTFVDDIDDRFLAGITNGLTQGEADDADNMLYDGLHDADGAFLGISQIQGNSLATMKLTAIDLDADHQGRALITNRGGDTAGETVANDVVEITRVIVYAADGTKLEDSGDLLNYNNAAIDVNLSGLTAVISGLNAGYKVEWETNGTHNQVLVEATAGKFDIGFFGLSEEQQVPDHVLNFEVTATDGDDDFAVSQFSVTVDALPYII